MARRARTAPDAPRKPPPALHGYDAFNRLSEVRDGANAVVATYTYDPFDRPLSKTVAGTATALANAGQMPYCPIVLLVDAQASAPEPAA